MFKPECSALVFLYPFYSSISLSGASAYAPENTLEAFRLAAEQGADGVELDVQLAVIHDERMDRVSDGIGYVKDFTLKELKELNFNSCHPEYETAVLPTLEEVYELLKPTGMMINVELKTGIIQYRGMEEAVLKLAQKMGIEDRIVYSSFFHPSLVRLKELDEQVKTGLLYSDGWIDTVRYGRDVVKVSALYHMQDERLAEEANRAGLDVRVWTVNEEEDMRRMIRLGVNALITNKPDLCRTVVDRTIVDDTEI